MLKRRKNDKLNLLRNKYFHYIEDQMQNKPMSQKVDMVEKYSKFLQRILIDLSDDFIKRKHQRFLDNQPQQEAKQANFYQRMQQDTKTRRENQQRLEEAKSSAGRSKAVAVLREMRTSRYHGSEASLASTEREGVSQRGSPNRSPAVRIPHKGGGGFELMPSLNFASMHGMDDIKEVELGNAIDVSIEELTKSVRKKHKEFEPEDSMLKEDEY